MLPFFASSSTSYQLLLSKIIYFLILIVARVILFAGIELAIAIILHGSIPNFNMPLYSLIQYSETPLNVTVFQFYLIRGLLRILSLFSLALFGFLFSMLFRSSLISSTLSLLMGITMLGATGMDTNSWNYGVYLLNPLHLLRPERFFKSTDLIVAGSLVTPTYWLFLFVLLISISVLILLIYQVARHQYCHVF